jgi:FkbM family methyltransferase
MSRHPFIYYLNPVFVETGSCMGDGIQAALSAGFKEIYSIEIQPNLHAHCKERFKDNPNVHVILGSSIDELPKLLSKISTPITFWLDAHYSQGPTGYDPRTTCPLMQELKDIASHGIKTHTILIDDIRMMKPSTNGGLDTYFDLAVDDVEKEIKGINPDYQINYVSGYQANDVMIANIPKMKILDQDLYASIGYDDCTMTRNGELKVIKQYIHSGNIVFDIGGNQGDWSRHVRQQAPYQIHIFEPQQTRVDGLLTLFSKDIAEHKVFVNATAISSSEQSGVDFFQYPTDELSGFYQRQVLAETPKKIQVQTQTIQEYCKQNKIDHIDFLKIDTEGHESKIIESLDYLLKQHAIRYLQFEYGGTFQDAKTTLEHIWKKLDTLGYKIYRISNEGLIAICKWQSSLENYRYSNYLAVSDK